MLTPPAILYQHYCTALPHSALVQDPCTAFRTCQHPVLQRLADIEDIYAAVENCATLIEIKVFLHIVRNARNADTGYCSSAVPSEGACHYAQRLYGHSRAYEGLKARWDQNVGRCARNGVNNDMPLGEFLSTYKTMVAQTTFVSKSLHNCARSPAVEQLVEISMIV